MQGYHGTDAGALSTSFISFVIISVQYHTDMASACMTWELGLITLAWGFLGLEVVIVSIVYINLCTYIAIGDWFGFVAEVMLVPKKLNTCTHCLPSSISQGLASIRD